MAPRSLKRVAGERPSISSATNSGVKKTTPPKKGAAKRTAAKNARVKKAKPPQARKTASKKKTRKRPVSRPHAPRSASPPAEDSSTSEAEYEASGPEIIIESQGDVDVTEDTESGNEEMEEADAVDSDSEGPRPQVLDLDSSDTDSITSDPTYRVSWNPHVARTGDHAENQPEERVEYEAADESDAPVPEDFSAEDSNNDQQGDISEDGNELGEPDQSDDDDDDDDYESDESSTYGYRDLVYPDRGRTHIIRYRDLPKDFQYHIRSVASVFNKCVSVALSMDREGYPNTESLLKLLKCADLGVKNIKLCMQWFYDAAEREASDPKSKAWRGRKGGKIA